MKTQQQFIDAIEVFLAENPEFTYDRILSVVTARVNTLSRSKDRREYDRVAREFFKQAADRGEAAVKARNIGSTPLTK